MSDNKKKLPQEPAPKQKYAEEGGKLSATADQNHEPGGVEKNKRPADTKKGPEEGPKSLGKVPAVSNGGPVQKDGVKDPFSTDLPLEEDDELDDVSADEVIETICTALAEQGLSEEEIEDYLLALAESDDETDEEVTDEVTDDEVSDELEEDVEYVTDEVTDEVTDDVTDDSVEELEITEEQVSTAIKDAIADLVEFKLDGSELGNLLEGEEGLTGEFKEKAVTVFEAAVTATASAHIEKIVEAATNAALLAVETIKADLTESVQAQLQESIDEWKEENKVQLQQNARLQIAESFMMGLKDLLETHYIELPEEKQDVFEDVCAENESLSESLKDSIETNEQLAEEVAALRKQLAVEKFVAGMTDLKAEKIRALAEGVAYEDAEDFGSKLKTLNENYFAGKAPTAKGDTAADEFLAEEDEQTEKPLNEADQIADWINKKF